MLEKGELGILSQYIHALEEASNKLEEAYFEKNIESFNKIKKFILEIQSKIDLMLK